MTQPPSGDAGSPGPAAAGDPASVSRTGRMRRRRVIAQPQSLETKTELTGSYAQLPRPDAVEQALAHRQGAGTAGRDQDTGPADPLARLRAKDEDPAGWGDRREDLAEQMKRDKPPHWG